jgi:hypothetical protein
MTTLEEVKGALVQRLIALGTHKAKVDEKATIMMNNWYRFSSNTVDEHGHETCRDWMDEEVVRLLDKALRADVTERHGDLPF